MASAATLPPLDYATPMARPARPPRLFIAVAAIAVALLTYEPFALAAGVPLALSDPYGHLEPGPVFGRILSGVVIFALVMTGTTPLLRQLGRFTSWLAAVRSKPSQLVAMTLI